MEDFIIIYFDDKYIMKFKAVKIPLESDYNEDKDFKCQGSSEISRILELWA